MLSKTPTSEDVRLPSEDELDAAWTAIADAEERVGAIARRVFEVANEERASVGWDAIGRLLVLVHEGRGLVRYIEKVLDNLESVARDELSEFARFGERMSQPRFQPDGSPRGEA